MRYFLDTEFVETGPHYPIDLISIGIVAEEGREFYRQSVEFDPETVNKWVRDNVLPGLNRCLKEDIIQDIWWHKVGGCYGDTDCCWGTLGIIKAGILDFIGDDPTPEFWGYFCDYDWVVFCQTMGRMVDLPKGWPMHMMDLKQWQVMLGRPDIKAAVPQENEHNALADARWNKKVWEFLNEIDLRRAMIR